MYFKNFGNFPGTKETMIANLARPPNGQCMHGSSPEISNKETEITPGFHPLTESVPR
jgi:hypothetical protein